MNPERRGLAWQGKYCPRPACVHIMTDTTKNGKPMEAYELSISRLYRTCKRVRRRMGDLGGKAEPRPAEAFSHISYHIYAE